MLGAMALSAAPLACGTSNIGSQVKPNAPTANEAMGAKLDCKTGSYAEPLVVDLPADKRVDLEAQMNAGVAMISYNCSEMTVVKDCRLPGKYAFAGVSLKEQIISLQNDDEMKANLPFSSGAASASLETGSQLDLALVMVGKRSTAARVERPALEGSQCGEATHFVRAATVGAFAMKTGTKGKAAAAVDLFGASASGSSSASEKRANKDGDLTSCKSSKPGAETPPDQCQSAIRVELVPIPAALAQADAKRAAELVKGAAEKEGKPIENPCSAEGFVYSDGKCARASSSAAPHLCAPANSDECKAECDKGHMGSCHNYAEALFSNFCNDPSKKSQCDQTSTAENQQREREAMKYWRKACDQGDVADACDQAGEYSLQTFAGMKADFAVAIPALKKGCDLGNADACWVLGDKYLKGGAGLSKDPMQGLALTDRSCKLGEQYSCQLMGEFYFKGTHLAKDPARGYAYLKQFCDQGEYQTCDELGEHLLGIFDKYEDKLTGASPVSEVPGADKIGRDLLTRSCTKGDRKDACARLGHLYYVEKNWAQARNFLQSGCKSDGDACKMMADMELEGKGGPKDKRSAMEYWLSSGDDELRYRAAQTFEKGDGVPKDAERATKIYGELCTSDMKHACNDAKRLDKKVWIAALSADCARDDAWSCSQLKAADAGEHRVQLEKLCEGTSEYGCKELKRLDSTKAESLVKANCEKEKADRSDDDKESCKLLGSLF